MGANVFEACREAGVAKLVAACSVCAYPKFTPVPFSEDDALGRLPGGVERAVRPGQEDADRAVGRLPPPVRLRLVRAGARQPLRPGRQLRPRGLARDRRDDPQVRRGDRARRAGGRAVGHRRAVARVPLRRRRGARPDPRRRALRLVRPGQHRHRHGRRASATSPRRSSRLTGYDGRDGLGHLAARTASRRATSTSAGPASASASRPRSTSRRACAARSRASATRSTLSA